MVNGSIRIKTRIDNSQAKKDAKEFEKVVSDAAENAKDSGEKSAVNIDVSQAEKEINRLEKDIERYQKKLNQLNNGKLGEFNEQKADIQALTDKDLRQAATDEQAAHVLEMEKITLEQLESKYKSVVAEAREYTRQIEQAKQRQAELKSRIEQAENAQKQANSEQRKSTAAASKTASKASNLKDMIRSAKNAAGEFAKNLSVKAVNGIKKAGSGIKQVSKTLKNMLKPADNLRKKFLKIGLAMAGMRGLMAGFRQIVSSALNDNEKLQNQLTAIKGVLGQALAPAINILLQGLSQIVTFADKLYQIFTGISLIAKYNASQTKKAAEAAEDYQNQLAGFDVANKLGDESSSNNNSNDTASLFQSVTLSSWLNDIINQIKNGDWYGAGETIADGINSALSKINWDSIQQKINTFCKNLGEAVNGFVNMLDWNKVGNSVGEGINTITNGINSIVDTIEWDSVGSGLATGMNGIVDSIDGNALGKTLSAKLKIITDTLYGFFYGDDKNDAFNFSNLGIKIGDTINGWFNNIDWGKIGSNISSVIKGIGDTLSNAIDTINWNDGEDSITQKIKDFFSNIDWAGMLNSACSALGKAIGGLGSTIVQLLKDAWNDWKSTYIDPAVEQAGGNIIEGIFNGIVNWLKDVGKWINDNILTPFIDGIKSTFDIHSPSKNPDILALGENIIAGVFNGIIDWLKDIGSWLKINVFDKITDAWDGMKELTLTIGGKIQDSFYELKSKWDSISEKGKTALSTIKGSIQSTFNTLKSKWDSIKNKTNTSSIKGSIQKNFNTLKSRWDSIKNKTNTSTIKGSITKSFNTAKSNWNSLKSKAITLTTSLKDGITNGIRSILNSLCNMVNKVIGVLNKIPGVNISRIPPPKLAKGGIVNNPGRGVTVTAGEAGPEAILPLNDSAMSRLAAMISEHQNTAAGQIIVPIYMDSKKILTYIVDAQNKQAFAMNKGGAY